jgi:hypothetical protein
MDMQKIQVRADLERMVYNYALLGKIDNDTADKIVSFIRLTIGGGDLPEPCGKVIDFPVQIAGNSPNLRKQNAIPNHLMIDGIYGWNGPKILRA